MATDATDVPPPLQDVPSAKEKKYDRQLRLWGVAGQIALERTHVLLVNNGSGVVGVEALKNLVLPGIGRFSILDSAIVSAADLGVNFFLDDSSLGKFRAVETVRWLTELNPDVKGSAIKDPLELFVARDDVFTPYTLILVAAPIDPAVLAVIRHHADALQIPTFYIHCVGYFSHFSVLLPPAFPIVDTHPDPTATTDLRLVKPWPALDEFAREKTAGMAQMNAHERGHIPYVCLLLHYLREWRERHDGRAPETYKEKQEFRDDYVGRDSPDEENFQEARAAVLKSLNPPALPSAVRDILAAPETDAPPSAASPPFWVIANAVRQFHARHAELPLPGAVPDMKAQSADYIRLQNIYKAKARDDCAEVLASVRRLEHALGRHGDAVVDEKEVENFCRGAAHVHLVRGRPFPVVQPGQPIRFGDRAKALASELTNPESLVAVHLAFLAWDEFVATHPSGAGEPGGGGSGSGGLRAPGCVDAELDADAQRMLGIARALTDRLIEEAGGANFDEPDERADVDDRIGKVCIELVRAAGVELHNIAALTGGLVAQEAIKVITRQYVPVDNTCLFDGVASRTYVLRV